MPVMSTSRALLRTLRERSHARRHTGPDAAVVSWGRIGAYQAVSREGILHLLAVDPAPALGVKPDA